MKFGSSCNSNFSENTVYKYSYSTAVRFGVHSSYSNFYMSMLKIYNVSSNQDNYKLIH